MSKRGICVSCGREMSLVARGLCHKCYSVDRADNKSEKDQTTMPRKTGLEKLFENDADLLESLTTAAQRNYRTVSGEILFRLRNCQE